MEKEKKHKKKDDGLTKSATISTNSLNIVKKIKQAQKISQQEALDMMIGFWNKEGASLSILDDKYELSLMNKEIKKSHQESNAVAKKFENEVLKLIEKNNENNFNFLNAGIIQLAQVIKNECIFPKQNFRLLRALVEADLEPKDSKILLQGTLAAIEESKNLQEKKEIASNLSIQNKTQHEESFTIAGRIGIIPKIGVSQKTNRVFCLLPIGTRSISSNDILWYDVNLWEGELTKKIGLTNQESIKSHFSKLNKGDLLKLYGYIQKNKRIEENGKEVILEAFIATEILEHISNSENK